MDSGSRIYTPLCGMPSTSSAALHAYRVPGDVPPGPSGPYAQAVPVPAASATDPDDYGRKENQLNMAEFFN